MPTNKQIYLGWDPRDFAGFRVAVYTIRQWDKHVPIYGLVLEDLRRQGLYYRPTEVRTNSDGHRQLWDVISEHPMATEFAVSRFLVPHIARSGWALFMDADVMALGNLSRIFDLADPSKAVMCVQHEHNPMELFKMYGQVQSRYSRKNWSSVMLFNCDHPSNKKLTVELVNTVPGRDLHRFCWLEDHEIGALPQEYNYLVGYTHLNGGRSPVVVHFTEGLPDIPGYEDQEYADQWRGFLPYAAGAL